MVAINHTRRWEVVAAFAFGCTFLTAILLIALYKPNPTAFEYTIYRIVIALAAAGVGAIIPGFLNVRFKSWLRAGGAVALFVVVYFFAPATMSAMEEAPVVTPSADAKLSSDNWLGVVDDGRFGEAYKLMSKYFQAQYKFEEFDQIIGRERRFLGRPSTRQLVSTMPLISPPGSPKGAYRQYMYRTKFSHESQQLYESVLLFGEENDWRVVGYFTAVKNQAGTFVPYEPNYSLENSATSNENQPG
jgi:hypothetical protein